MKFLNIFRKRNRLWNDYKNGKATVYTDLDPIVKEKLTQGAMFQAGKLLMFTFMSCNLKTHMECTIVNEANGDVYQLEFRKINKP